MKFIVDFFPIIAFFIAYKFSNIYVATGVAIIISVLQTLFFWIKERKLASMQILSLVLIILFGGGTLLLHDEMLIKWKPTVLYWLLALMALGSQLLQRKPFIQKIMEANIELPRKIWLYLNLSWVAFFIIVGVANIIVAYHFSTNTWVNFKLFGLLGLTLVFVVGQACYIGKYAKPTEKTGNNHGHT